MEGPPSDSDCILLHRFTSDQKEQFAGVSGVTITTYTMVSFSGRRSEESQKVACDIEGFLQP